MTAGELVRSPRIRMLGLMVAILVLFAMLWQNEEPTTPGEAATLRGKAEPDAFVTAGRYLSFNETGQLARRIESQRIEQFESEQMLRMQQPRATLFGEAGDVSWELEAQKGEFLQTMDLVHLTGDVRLTRLADQSGALSPSEPMSLSTEALTLDSDERTVYTSEPVKITDALGVTRATGMKAWIDRRILELNAQVEGRYEPAR